MSNQGTIRLKVTNGAPAIEKLWNGRFKLEFFCDNNSPREDWYYENVSALLPEYGILQATNFGSGVSEDWEAIPDSVYPDMRLVLAEYPYNVRAGKHYVKLTYETLTASWVEEKAEDIDYELNGLKSISRTFVALPDTAYTNVIGTSTITSGGTTLYLGGFNIEETDAKWELTEVWFESGQLSVQRTSESEGVYKVTTTFLAVEGTVVGPIIARTINDSSGLKTITVVSMQNSNGESLASSGSQPIASHSVLNDFTYPGVVTISNTTLSGTGSTFNFQAKDFSLKPPCASRVPATIKISFKDTSTIAYSSSGGLWNPITWAEGTSLGIGWNYSPFSISRGFRGYRTGSGINGYAGSGSDSPTFDMISGKRIYVGTSYSIQVSGGPASPESNEYTLDYGVSLAFEDVNGVAYYKHREVVATIPSR